MKKVYSKLIVLGLFYLFHMVLFAQKPSIKVVLMGGQSNMVGFAEPATLPSGYTAEIPQVTIKSSGEPAIQFDWTNLRSNEGFGGNYGPEVALGRDIVAAFGTTKIGLIKWAWGGHVLARDFRPPSSGGTLGPDYSSTISFMTATLNELKVNYDVEVLGYCWMQGESDGTDLTWSNAYEVNLTNYIKDLRTALGLPNMPFVIGMIDISTNWPYNSIIRQAEINVANKVPYVGIFDTHGFPTNGAHYQGQGMIDLGHRFADGILSFRCPKTLDWEFNTDNSIECWNLYNSLTGNTSGGYLNLTITGGDSFMISPDNLNFDATTLKSIHVKMKNNTAETVASIYFTRSDATWSGTLAKSFNIKPNDSGYTEYMIDMGGHAEWKGTIKQIRIDPLASLSAGTVNIDFIKIIESNCTSQTIDFPVIYSKSMTDGPFTVSATASSGLPVTFSIISGPATVNGNTVSLKGIKGVVKIAATQVGDATHCAAVSTQEITVFDPNFSTKIWHFENSLEGWVMTHNSTGSAANSILSATITDADPNMLSPDNLGLNAATYKYLMLKIKNSTGKSDGKIYWSRNDATGLDESKSLVFAVSGSDTGYKTYTVDMSTSALWTGTIKQVRFDFAESASSGTMLIDYIAFDDDGLINVVTGVNEKEINESITIYPNPVQDNGFYIESGLLNKNSKIEVVNMQGQLVFEQKLSGNAKEFIQIQNEVTKGIYLIRISDMKTVITKKIVIH